MRVKTRSGEEVSLLEKSVKKQEKVVTNGETYYVVQLQGNRTMHLSKPYPGVKFTVIDLRSKPSKEK